MSRFLVHHDGLYLEWSTVVDAPTTFGMTPDELREYVKDRYGSEGLDILDERMHRARLQGTSCRAPRYTFDDIVSGNRAGPDEAELTREQFIETYFRPAALKEAP